MTARSGLAPLPHRIRTLINKKRRLRKLWQHSRCPSVKTELNALAARIRDELDSYDADRWDKHIESIGDGLPNVHRLCAQLSGARAPTHPLLSRDGTPRFRAADRAEIFAECLEEQFRPNPSTDAEHVATVDQHVRDLLEEPLPADEDPIFFSPGVVARAFSHVKPRKAPGPDAVGNMALRSLPWRTVTAVTRLFNGIMRTGHFPVSWREGRVIMIPKGGKDVRRPESYRPITLLPAISKVFEKLLLRHLIPHIVPRPEQFGFRAEHSTTLQLTRVLHAMTVAFDKKEYTVAVLLDMEKAFDRVWHNGLLFKISQSQTPRRVIRVLTSFLEDRRFHVAVEGAMSSVRPIRAGVPQGSCLSPFCYSRYTDDIPVVDGTELALYADDAAYFSTSFRANHAAVKMQRCLDALPEWLQKWRLSVNVGKTQAMCIQTHKGGPATTPSTPLMLNGQSIAWSSKVKYLGVTIDWRLSMKPHVESVIGQTRVARNKLYPVFSSRLPFRTKLAVYKLYVRSRLTYAAPAWFALTNSSLRQRLRAQQNLTLRTIANAPRYVRNATLHRDLKMDSLDKFINHLASEMFARADASDLPHIRGLAPLHARPPDAESRYARHLVIADDEL